MEEDVLSALRSRAAYLPGGRDREGRVLIVVHVPNDLQQPWSRRCMEISVNYIRKSLSADTLNEGLTIVIDAQKCSSRLTRTQSRVLLQPFGHHLANILLVRSDSFWDKRVEHCAKTQEKGEPIVITKSRLQKYFEMSELPDELGGTLAYNHDLWIQNRVRIEDFRAKFEKAINDLENLHVLLLDHKPMRLSEIDQAIQACAQTYDDVQSAVKRVIEVGNQLTATITDSYQLPSAFTTGNNSITSNNGPSISSCDVRIPQDLIGELAGINDLLNEIEKKQSSARSAWNDLERSVKDARQLAALEEGVSYVTNWILGTAEGILNRQQKVGCDVPTCEDLRREMELLEMQCWDTYGFYAELLHKINTCSVNKESFVYKDLMSQRDFMDFVCRSFATRLERRRNILITSLRFFRLVSEYFDKTSEVFDSLIMGNRIDDYDLAMVNLQKLKDSQHNLDNVEKELVKEGEKLSDMLSMPVKDALGCDIGIDYSDDIANIRDILDATIARRNIFIDSVELQKLTLEQVTHIHLYEQDAKVAIKWMDDLYAAMIKCHSHVGCNVHEIQVQKDELQTFQETGKSIYNYGYQLLEASLALRQSCKLDSDFNTDMVQRLRKTWTNLQSVSQEQMTRLRVSAVFHRSVEEYCNKLLDLKANVTTIGEIDESERRRIRLRKYLALRERLLVEVGRMVRLGRLLKTRLKEPFILDEKINGSPPPNGPVTVTPTRGNSIASDAITNKLTEVADVAESLDSVLRDTQNGLDLIETNSNSSDKKFGEHHHNGSFDEWNSSVRSTEDDSFLTASEYTLTPQSRSSSFQTASEGRGTSPWMSSLDTEDYLPADSGTPPSRLLHSVLSSANASFDSSDQSFLSAQQSPQPHRPAPPPPPPASTSTESTPQPETPDSSDPSPVGMLPPAPPIPPKGDRVAAHPENLMNGQLSNGHLSDAGDRLEPEKPEVRCSEIRQSAAWSNNYYQNVIAQQAIKGCL